MNEKVKVSQYIHLRRGSEGWRKKVRGRRLLLRAIPVVALIGAALPFSASAGASVNGLSGAPSGIPIPTGSSGGVQITPGTVATSDGWIYFNNALSSVEAASPSVIVSESVFVQGSPTVSGGCSYSLVGPAVPIGSFGFAVTTAIYPKACVTEVSFGTSGSNLGSSSRSVASPAASDVSAFAKGFEEDPLTITVTAAIANIAAYDPAGTSITSPTGSPHYIEFADGWSATSESASIGNRGPSKVSYTAASTSYNGVFGNVVRAALGPIVGLAVCGTANATQTSDTSTVTIAASGIISATAVNTASGACTSFLSPELSYGPGSE